MANASKEKDATQKVETAAPATEYTMQEFIDAADTLFGDVDKAKRPSRYIIMAAFRFAKKDKATKDEGRALIQKFMERKVK